MSETQTLRTVHVLAQGPGGLSSHPSLCDLVQIAWPLAGRGVVPEDVIAFLTSLPGQHPWPSARPGLPPLQLPPGYEKSLRVSGDDLSGAVNREMMALLGRNDVGTIVFFYSGHGLPTKSQWIDATLDLALVTNWVTSAVDFGKKLFFVLNACHSTEFAQAVIGHATGVFSGEDDEDDEDDQRRLRSSVGFLTSGTEACCPSTILVSREEGLVYLFDGEQKERGLDGLALGYRQDSGAFFREFLWLWTYVLTVGMRIKIADLPGLMNDPTAPPPSPKPPSDS
jgi:hypothetical protein